MLDGSASMLRAGRLAQAKGVLAELMKQAYRRRDRVALVHIQGGRAQLVLPPQRASALPQDALAPLAGGGGTPLAAALALADALLQRHAQGLRPLWLLSDGRSRETPPRPRAAGPFVLIDFEDLDGARVPLGRGAELAALWGAAHWSAQAFWAPQEGAAA
ncbi:MAG: hypothetical protein AMXMBFR78_22890 [Rubrivivax sp.]